jgi:hypothetical protein
MKDMRKESLQKGVKEVLNETTGRESKTDSRPYFCPEI